MSLLLRILVLCVSSDNPIHGEGCWALAKAEAENPNLTVYCDGGSDLNHTLLSSSSSSCVSLPCFLLLSLHLSRLGSPLFCASLAELAYLINQARARKDNPEKATEPWVFKNADTALAALADGETNISLPEISYHHPPGPSLVSSSAQTSCLSC